MLYQFCRSTFLLLFRLQNCVFYISTFWTPTGSLFVYYSVVCAQMTSIRRYERFSFLVFAKISHDRSVKRLYESCSLILVYSRSYSITMHQQHALRLVMFLLASLLYLYVVIKDLERILGGNWWKGSH